MRKKLEHPCKLDCPRRSGLCRKTCPDWQEYVQRRDEQYKNYRLDPDFQWAGYVFDIKNRIYKKLRKKEKK